MGSSKCESVQRETGKVDSIITSKWMNWISRVLMKPLLGIWKQLGTPFPFCSLGASKTKISLILVSVKSSQSLVVPPLTPLFYFYNYFVVFYQTCCTCQITYLNLSSPGPLNHWTFIDFHLPSLLFEVVCSWVSIWSCPECHCGDLELGFPSALTHLCEQTLLSQITASFPVFSSSDTDIVSMPRWSDSKQS